MWAFLNSPGSLSKSLINAWESLKLVKPTRTIRGHVTPLNHRVCVGFCSSENFVWGGNDAFQQSQLFIIRSWKCGESARQLQQEVTHVRVYSSQSEAERSTLCNKWVKTTPRAIIEQIRQYSTTREIGEDWGCRVHSLRVVFLIKYCVPNKKKKKKSLQNFIRKKKHTSAFDHRRRASVPCATLM